MASLPSQSPRINSGVPLRWPRAATTLIVGSLIVAALSIARDIFVPLALAILLSFALGPLVQFLRRCRFGRIPSIIAAVLLAFLVIFGVGAMIGGQLAELAGNLPAYRSNVIDKIDALQQSMASNGLFTRGAAIMSDLGKEVAKTPPPASGTPAAPHAAQPQKPMPVEIHQPEPTPYDIVESIVGPLLQPLATTGIVIVFVIFFLAQREDLRDRFIRLAGVRDIQRTTHALDDAGERLSGYLLAQSGINACFGILVGIGLWIIGVPNPLLWGTLALLLRFVPYIGAIIAALFPVAMAIATDPGWTTLLWTAVLFLVAEPVTSQVIEPILYGHSTGLSPVAVVLAAAFWTWLWGPIGLLLSTPLTLCLVVLGRHVEHLQFLAIAFGDRPALAPEESLYQRMLANDPAEAAFQAEAFLKSKPLAAYYDEVAVKALALAQADVNRGLLDYEHRTQIKAVVDDIIDDLAEHDDADPAETEPPAEALPEWGDGAVLCIAGRGALDEAAAAMLAQLLVRGGIPAEVVPSSAVAPRNIRHLDLARTRLICLSYLEPEGFTNAHFLVRRLRRRLADVPLLVGFWTMEAAEARQLDAREQSGADEVVTSLGAAVAAIRQAARAGAPAAA